jgi:hypothetical protein
MFLVLNSSPSLQRRPWHVAFTLFLAVLLPLAPVLAQAQEEGAAAHGGCWREGNGAGRTRAGTGDADSATALDRAEVFAALFERMQNDRTTQILFLLEGLSVPEEDPCRRGTLDADREHGGTLWFVLGLLTGPWGVGAAYIVSPSPSNEAVQGKSSSFATAYTACYKNAARGVHTKWAWIGFGTFVLLWCVAVGIIYLLGAGARGSN